ncbi:MAG: hypothetical protein WCK18_05370 [Prolixibacteraceae bacterium]
MKRKVYLFWTIMIMFMTTAPFLLKSQSDWKNDFKFQELNKRPNLEVRYQNGDRDAFEIVAADYHLTGDLVPPNLLYDTNTSVPWLWFEMTDQQGQLYSTRDTKTKSRINLYRRGPYYCEIHWVDMRFANQKGDTLPIRAEVVLYCFPDKMKSSVKLFPSAQLNMKTLTAKGKVEKSLAIKALEKGQPQYFNFDLFQEVKPLQDAAFTLKKGVTPVKYDQRKGVYTIGSETTEGFQKQYFEQPNGYEEVAFKVKNDGIARKIYICHKTLKGEGIVEGGVVLDEKGNPLPILVQVCKNFAGEKEEKFYNPRDTAFSETYFPLYLEPNEELDISSLHVYQNWGRHMTKHWSSLGFFMDYFHSSTGVTETTCYIPFKFGHKTGISIGDFRAMSQETFWEGQPQHDNVAGHNFLTYYDGKKWNYSEYKGTTYKSTGANWCNVEMEYLSSDSSIRLLLDIWELPQDDELRSFFTARYKVLRPLTIEDAKANFRFLDISTTQQRLRYNHFAFTDPSGKIISKPIVLGEEAFCAKGIELPAENSFTAIYGEPKGSNGIMIRNFKTNINLKPAFLIQHKVVIPEPKDTTVNEHKVYTPPMKNEDVRFSLVPSADRLILKPGDEIELNGFWLPYGEYNGYKTPAREAVTFGSNQPRVTKIKKGLCLNNFPTTIQVENNQAEFTMKGGLNIIPVIAKGFTDYRNLMLYRKINGTWDPVFLNQNTESDGNQVFCDTDGKFGAIFLFKTNGAEQEMKISSGPSGLTRKLKIEPVTGPQTEVKIADEKENTSVILKINPLHSNKIPIKWLVSEGNSIWCTHRSDQLRSGIRLTGFEKSATLQYWWQPESRADSLFTPEFELKIGGKNLKEAYILMIYDNGKLGEYKSGKPQIVKLATEENSPGIVFLYSAKMNRTIALAFNKASEIYLKDKNTVGIRMKQQKCPMGRRKVFEGKVYIADGNAVDLLQLIKQELTIPEKL